MGELTMTRFLMTVAATVGLGATALAGGPPPVYVVVDDVKVETASGPERVTIRGSFVRLADVRTYEYGKPVQGFVILNLDEKKAAECRAEWKDWAKAAGTGKVVAVGTCGEAGAMLNVHIHEPGDKATVPNGTYTPGFLGKLDLPGRGWSDEEPVKALQAFVKESKTARRTRQ
jgi:hypothetical protein